VGASGYGRYGGQEGYKNFTNRKAILIKKPSPPFALNLSTPPFTDGKKRRLRCLLPWISGTTQQTLQRFTGFITLLMIVIHFRAFFFGMSN